MDLYWTIRYSSSKLPHFAIFASQSSEVSEASSDITDIPAVLCNLSPFLSETEHPSGLFSDLSISHSHLSWKFLEYRLISFSVWAIGNLNQTFYRLWTVLLFLFSSVSRSDPQGLLLFEYINRHWSECWRQKLRFANCFCSCMLLLLLQLLQLLGQLLLL